MKCDICKRDFENPDGEIQQNMIDGLWYCVDCAIAKADADHKKLITYAMLGTFFNKGV